MVEYSDASVYLRDDWIICHFWYIRWDYLVISSRQLLSASRYSRHEQKQNARLRHSCRRKMSRSHFSRCILCNTHLFYNTLFAIDILMLKTRGWAAMNGTKFPRHATLLLLIFQFTSLHRLSFDDKIGTELWNICILRLASHACTFQYMLTCAYYASKISIYCITTEIALPLILTFIFIIYRREKYFANLGL